MERWLTLYSFNYKQIKKDELVNIAYYSLGGFRTLTSTLNTTEIALRVSNRDLTVDYFFDSNNEVIKSNEADLIEFISRFLVGFVEHFKLGFNINENGFFWGETEAEFMEGFGGFKSLKDRVVGVIAELEKEYENDPFLDDYDDFVNENDLTGEEINSLNLNSFTGFINKLDFSGFGE